MEKIVLNLLFLPPAYLEIRILPAARQKEYYLSNERINLEAKAKITRWATK